MQTMARTTCLTALRPLLVPARQRCLTTAASAPTHASWLSKAKWFVYAGVVGGAGTVWYALEHSVEARDLECHPYPVPWTHNGVFDSLDIESARRGYQVYKQVCAACHSMKFRRFRHLCDNRWPLMSEEEAKAEAEDSLADDIDDVGKAIQRPGQVTDIFPAPYKNNKEAAAANNGAVPPDLSLMVLARHGAEDYIFSLLTSYVDAPAGVQLGPGQAYNPYFLNGVLSMGQQLFDDGVEYYDGTPATVSQQAKDVSTFLRWTSEPYHDARKKIGLKILLVLPLMVVPLLYLKRVHRVFYHNSRFAWQRPRGRAGPPPTDAAPKHK